MYYVNALPSIISIGHQGEGGVTPIEIDVSAWVADYPGLPISISITDPQDSANVSPFLAAGVTLSGNTLTWLVGKDATQHAGLGTIVIRCADGGTDKRSARTQILIDVGHGAAGEAPEPMADWLAEADALRQEIADGVEAVSGSAETATAKAGEANTAKLAAESARDTAVTKAGEAASSAQAASTSAGQANTAKQAAEAARDTAVTKAGEASESAGQAAQSAAVYDGLAGTVAGHTTQLADIATRNLKYWSRPAAYRIRCAAGRMAFSWNNASGRMWVFPAGTVLHSNGTTPIRTSIAEKPDVDIPVGGGDVWLVSAMWAGAYLLSANETDVRLTGALSDLPPLTYYLSLYNCSLVTGALYDLPPLTYLLSLYNCSLVTGALSDLPPLTYRLDLTNCSLVTGALSDLPPLTYHLSLYNCSLVTGAYTAVNGGNVPTITTLTGTGLSSADMDATLIAYAATTKSGGSFTATGKTRTAASDAAVATLTGRGWTISGITKV